MPALASAAVVASPVTDAVTFEVLDEDFVMADAILAEQAPAGAPPRAGVELPWITTFLDDVPEAAAASAGLDVAVAHPVDEAIAERGAIEAELWPLDDAGSRMCALAKALASHTASARAVVEHVATHGVHVPAHGAAPVAPLAMWSDDDFVDVMPVHATSLPVDVVTADVARSIAPARDRADTHESAALALEALARRVRRREVDFPAFDAELGDAAALATALVVLLGPRP